MILSEPGMFSAPSLMHLCCPQRKPIYTQQCQDTSRKVSGLASFCWIPPHGDTGQMRQGTKSIGMTDYTPLKSLPEAERVQSFHLKGYASHLRGVWQYTSDQCIIWPRSKLTATLSQKHRSCLSVHDCSHAQIPKYLLACLEEGNISPWAPINFQRNSNPWSCLRYAHTIYALDVPSSALFLWFCVTERNNEPVGAWKIFFFPLKWELGIKILQTDSTTTAMGTMWSE